MERLSNTLNTNIAGATSAQSTTSAEDVKEAAPAISTASAADLKTPDPALSFEFSATLDNLWDAGKYTEAVESIRQDLSNYSDKSYLHMGPVEASAAFEKLFVLQHRSLALLNKFSMVTEPAAKTQAMANLNEISDLRTHLFRRVVDLDNETREPVYAWQIYRNTLKDPVSHTRSEIQAYYLKKAEKFISKGGDFSQIKEVTPEFFAGLRSGELCEWAVDAYDSARITSSEVPVAPGHTLLSQGHDALAAGSMRVFKNEEGEIENVIIGTFSGHFRSPRESLHHMARHLVAAGIPADKISLQEGEAGSTRTLDVLLYSVMGIEGAEAQTNVARLNAEAMKWKPYGDDATIKKTEKAEKLEVKDERPKEAALPKSLVVALSHMRAVTNEALADGAILSGQGEDVKIARAMEEVLDLAQRAGSSVATGQAMALLGHISSLPVTAIDSAAAKSLGELKASWDAKIAAGAPIDSADVLGARPPNRRARVIATLNPKEGQRPSRTELIEMITAGMDVARINLAHGSLQEQQSLIKEVRAAAADLSKPVSILIDLPGPKIRLGKFANPDNLEFNDIWLKDGEKLTLTTADIKGDNKTLPVDYAPLGQDVKAGDPIFLNDGTVELRAISSTIDPDTGVATVEAEVLRGGKVWDNKGINLPGSSLSMPTVPPSDVEALEALRDDVDMVGVSFVRSAQDILFVRSKMAQQGRIVPIIAKIERPEAMENLFEIANVSDSLMVARGDLGVEIGPLEVPAAERKIHAMGNRLGKPTIVATEVLQSMVKNGARPTRSEVDAVYGAIHDQGADAIMLAKETSFGKYANRAIQFASTTIQRAEEELHTESIATIASNGTTLPSMGSPLDIAAAQARNL